MYKLRLRYNSLKNNMVIKNVETIMFRVLIQNRKPSAAEIFKQIQDTNILYKLEIKNNIQKKIYS